MKITPFFRGKFLKSNFVTFLVLVGFDFSQLPKLDYQISSSFTISATFSLQRIFIKNEVYFYPSGISILNFCKISVLIKHLNLEMLGKYSTILNTRPATTHIYAMRTYFSPWQTSTANVIKPFLCKSAHPVRLNIGTLENLPSCFYTSRFKSLTSIHCQLPLQKHVNN